MLLTSRRIIVRRRTLSRALSEHSFAGETGCDLPKVQLPPRQKLDTGTPASHRLHLLQAAKLSLKLTMQGSQSAQARLNTRLHF